MYINIYKSCAHQMSLALSWTHIKKRNPSSPTEFMQVLFECNPDVDEFMIVRWQRASRDWTTNIFEFIWCALQVQKGNHKWERHVTETWPAVKATIDAHCLDELLQAMCI